MMKIRLIGLVKKMLKLPLDMISERRKFDSTELPKISPTTKGAAGIPKRLKARPTRPKANIATTSKNWLFMA